MSDSVAARASAVAGYPLCTFDTMLYRYPRMTKLQRVASQEDKRNITSIELAVKRTANTRALLHRGMKDGRVGTSRWVSGSRELSKPKS